MPQLQSPARSAPHSEMLADVQAGLARPQKELPPKYFYDHAGSLLFEEITRLPEYYLTRVERELLLQCTQWFVTEHRLPDAGGAGRGQRAPRPGSCSTGCCAPAPGARTCRST